MIKMTWRVTFTRQVFLSHCNHKSYRVCLAVAQAERPLAQALFAGQAGRLSIQVQHRLAGFAPQDFYLEPADSADACPERLGYRLFRGEPRRQRSRLALALLQLMGGEDPLQEPPAIPLNRPLDTFYLNQVYTGS